MNWIQHAIASTIAAALVFLLIAWFDGPEFGPLDVVALFSYSLPDVDQKSMLGDKYRHAVSEPSKHRHWFWHSSAIVLVVFLLGLFKGNLAGISVFAVVIGTHLFCDLKPGEKGKRGTYLIYLHKGNRMSRRNTDLYLLLNGVFCYTVALLSLLS